MPLHFDVFEINCRNIHLTYETDEKKRRLYFVALSLYVFLQKGEIQMYPDCRSSIKSLKLAFKAIKEPFITEAEIER